MLVYFVGHFRIVLKVLFMKQSVLLSENFRLWHCASGREVC